MLPHLTRPVSTWLACNFCTVPSGLLIPLTPGVHALAFCSWIWSRITGWLRLEGTTGGHLVHPPLLKQGTLLRTVSRWLLDISRERDSATSLGNLFHHLVALTVKLFVMFRWNFQCSSFCLLPFVLAPQRGVWLQPLDAFSSDTYMHLSDLPLSLLFSRLDRPCSHSPSS